MIPDTSITQTSRYLVGYKSATVVGLGATGYSVVRYLAAHGFDVSVVDSRVAPPLAARLQSEYPEVAAYYGHLDVATVAQAELIVLSPGVSLQEPAMQLAKSTGTMIIGDVELFLTHNTRPVIAITGSNGKSTVTTLVGELCEAAGLKALVAGNIGKPVLDALTDQEAYDIAVLELSSFQLETTKQVPAEAATILNISEDHMDRYRSMGDYVLAKARVLRGAKRAILPRQEPQLEQITSINQQISFGLDVPASSADYGVIKTKTGRWLAVGDKPLVRLKDVPLVGLHNISNVLAAFALVEFLAIPTEVLKSTVQQFKGLPHRMQTVVVDRGVTWVNDSKATNVGATASALSSLESPVIWIAGGEGKGADFASLNHAMSNVKLALLFGADATKIQHAIASSVEVLLVDSLSAAVKHANNIAQEGDIVLLSPACASFDMFDNFEHRGDAFITCVQAVIGQAEVKND